MGRFFLLWALCTYVIINVGSVDSSNSLVSVSQDDEDRILFGALFNEIKYAFKELERSALQPPSLLSQNNWMCAPLPPQPAETRQFIANMEKFCNASFGRPCGVLARQDNGWLVGSTDTRREKLLALASQLYGHDRDKLLAAIHAERMASSDTHRYDSLYDEDIHCNPTDPDDPDSIECRSTSPSAPASAGYTTYRDRMSAIQQLKLMFDSSRESDKDESCERSTTVPQMQLPAGTTPSIDKQQGNKDTDDPTHSCNPVAPNIATVSPIGLTGDVQIGTPKNNEYFHDQDQWAKMLETVYDEDTHIEEDPRDTHILYILYLYSTMLHPSFNTLVEGSPLPKFLKDLIPSFIVICTLFGSVTIIVNILNRCLRSLRRYLKQPTEDEPNSGSSGSSVDGWFCRSGSVELPIYRTGDHHTKQAKSIHDITWTEEALRLVIKGRQIGCGSYGRVFIGIYQPSGLEVAIKKITCAPNGTDGFGSEKELSVLSSLNHPNVVKYLGAIREADNMYLFLEYIANGSLADSIKKYGTLSEPVIRNYTIQLLYGLSYLHGKDIIHRDIKPANILITADGITKITDFGACRDVSTSISTHHISGTVMYLAPEAARGRPCMKSDVWSLGCTLLELATGRQPWADEMENHDNILSLMWFIGQSDTAPTIPLLLSHDFSSFLQRCFTLDVNKRPTASQLLLDPFVTNQPIVSESPTLQDACDVDFNRHKGHHHHHHHPHGITLSTDLSSLFDSSRESALFSDITSPSPPASISSSHSSFTPLGLSQSTTTTLLQHAPSLNHFHPHHRHQFSNSKSYPQRPIPQPFSGTSDVRLTRNIRTLSDSNVDITKQNNLPHPNETSPKTFNTNQTNENSPTSASSAPDTPSSRSTSSLLTGTLPAASSPSSLPPL